jgi:hypothetical protein
VGVLRVWDVVEGESHPRYELEDKEEQREPSGEIPGIEPVGWDGLQTGKVPQRFDIVPL